MPSQTEPPGETGSPETGATDTSGDGTDTIEETGDTEESGETADTGDTGATVSSDCLVVDPFPAALVDASGLSVREGTVRFVARDGNELVAHTYRATGYAKDGPIVFVLHGTDRTASSYLDAFRGIAERYGALAVAPEFPADLYPDSEAYTTGVGTGDVPYGGTYEPAEWRAPEDYIYSEIEHFFEAIKAATGSTRCGYRLFGHSAGSQFVHRLLTFRPDARVERAVAANAGWYTLATDGGGEDPDYYFPYGLQGSPMNVETLAPAFARGLVVLLGLEDTATSAEDPDVRGTEEAEAQGATRLERGRTYFATAEAAASGYPFAWTTSEVTGAGHDKDEMAQSAGFHLFAPLGEAPCSPSAAWEGAGLVINEVHADPAGDASGDANGDGVRDAAEDEFIEIVNGGASPVCLEGWSLHDGDEMLHLFPEGAFIEPGAAVVVFGGGTPTGTFGDATVQWAAYAGDLDLLNDGATITLADASGDAVTALSWGDCGGGTCAEDHWPDSLAIDQSLTRDPDTTGSWVEHTLASGELYSPGARVDGADF